NIAPLRLPRHCRSVVKMQNVAPFSATALNLEADRRGKLRLLALRYLTRAALRRADGVIYISRSSQDAVGIRSRRSEVIYDGLTSEAGAVPIEQARAAAEARFGLRTRFVLSVADLYPYKNLSVL